MQIFNGTQPQGGYLEGVQVIDNSVTPGVTIWSGPSAFTDSSWSASKANSNLLRDSTVKLLYPISALKTGLEIRFTKRLAYYDMTNAMWSEGVLTSPIPDNSVAVYSLQLTPTSSSQITKESLLAGEEIQYASMTRSSEGGIVQEFGYLSVKAISNSEISFISHGKYVDSKYSQNSTAYERTSSGNGWTNQWLEIDSIVSY